MWEKLFKKKFPWKVLPNKAINRGVKAPTEYQLPRHPKQFHPATPPPTPLASHIRHTDKLRVFRYKGQEIPSQALLRKQGALVSSSPFAWHVGAAPLYFLTTVSWVRVLLLPPFRPSLGACWSRNIINNSPGIVPGIVIFKCFFKT